MFKNSIFATVLPRWSRKVLPFWDRYLDSWDTIFAFGEPRRWDWTPVILNGEQRFWPPWAHHPLCQHWVSIPAGKRLIDRKMKELEGHVEKGMEVSQGYLSYLLASGHLSLDEVYGSVAELLLAGVDTVRATGASPERPSLSTRGMGREVVSGDPITPSATCLLHASLSSFSLLLTPVFPLHPQTSNTLCWALYHLSRDLGIQETLYQELKAVVPPDRFPGAEDIPKMPMLRAVIKETLRYSPCSLLGWGV